MKKLTLQLVMLLVGVVAGFGIGTLISKPKIEQCQQQVDELTAQLERSKAAKTESEEAIRKASTEIVRYKNELSRTKNALTQTITQLANVKAELEKARSQAQPAQSTPVAQTSKPTTTTTKPAPTAKTIPTAGTVEYTVQDGDSLWNIAQDELGNGIRFKEIIDLNPGVTENTVLQKGMKLKIPAR